MNQAPTSTKNSSGTSLAAVDHSTMRAPKRKPRTLANARTATSDAREREWPGGVLETQQARRSSGRAGRRSLRRTAICATFEQDACDQAEEGTESHFDVCIRPARGRDPAAGLGKDHHHERHHGRARQVGKRRRRTELCRHERGQHEDAAAYGVVEDMRRELAQAEFTHQQAIWIQAGVPLRFDLIFRPPGWPARRAVVPAQAARIVA